MTDSGRTPKTPILKRVMQTLSREMEFFTVDELRKQTGQPEELWWPECCCKELIDNGIDAAEQSVAVPVIEIKLTPDKLEVKDNGPGIPLRAVLKTLDFTTRTSDKMTVVSPSRGSQGNALKTILAIPYVHEKKPVTIEIRAAGWHHRVHVETNQLKQIPTVKAEREPVIKTEGSSFLIPCDSASGKAFNECLQSLMAMVLDFAFFNPHCTFILNGHTIQTGKAGLKKWTMDEPTCAHWYDLERFKAYAGMLLVDDEGKEVKRTVRDFIQHFAGFSSDPKVAAVLDPLRLQKVPLANLAKSANAWDDPLLKKLLRALQAGSKPTKPQKLGVLGEARFRVFIDDSKFRYAKRTGIDSNGLPFVIEAAFGEVKSAHRGLHYGINFSVPIGAALAATSFTGPGEEEVYSERGYTYEGLSALLAQHRVNLHSDDVCLCLHIVCPRLEFLDKGKSNVKLSYEMAEKVRLAVEYVTRDWTKKKRALERGIAQAVKPLPVAKPVKLTIEEAFQKIAVATYNETSSEGKFLPTNRQLYYTAHDLIQEHLDCELVFSTFDKAMKAFIREHPAETKGWKIWYDPRGYLEEPHTRRTVPMGTKWVDEYLAQIGPEDADPTTGPGYHYGTIIYIEKKGLAQQIQDSGLRERYDFAVLYGEGFSVIADRVLLERVAAAKVRIFVLHDFDVPGLGIAQTLQQDSEAFQFKEKLQVIDLGLRLADVKKWKLRLEDKHYPRGKKRKQRDWKAALKGWKATPEEVEALIVGPDGVGGWNTRRAELSALRGADTLIRFIEAKLIEHKVQKLMPKDAMLENLYESRRLERLEDEAEMAAAAERQRISDELWADFNARHKEEMDAIAADVKKEQARVHVREVEPDIPADLHDRVTAYLKEHREVLWTAAVEAIEEDEPVEEDTEPEIDEPEPAKF